MKLRIVLSVAGAAIVAAAGCAGGNSSTSSSSSAAIPQRNKVVVDGQDRGTVTRVGCTTNSRDVRMLIGIGKQGVVAVLTGGDQPWVKSLHFNFLATTGESYAFDSGTDQGNAEAAKTGNTYKITGMVTGGRTADPAHQAKKSFEIDVTCQRPPGR